MKLPIPKPGILDIKPYVGGEHKAEGAARLIRLASNENPYGCSLNAEAAFKEAALELHRYPDGASHELRNAIASIYKLPAEKIVCGAGSDELIALITKAYAGADDEVLYSEHGFLMYPLSAKSVGATPVAAAEQYLKADIEALLTKITNRTKIVMLANPNNPTGSHLSKDEVRSLAERLPPHIILMLDAAYAEYAIADDYSAGHELVKEFPNVIVLHTFSKIYGLASLRLGWCYASPDITDVLNRVRGPFNVSLPAQRAGVAAMQDQDFVTHARLENAALMQHFIDDLRNLGLQPYLSQANFVLVDFGDADRAENVRLFLKQHGILVRQMPAYNLPTCLRITIGTAEDMEDVTTALQEALKSNER